MSDNIQDTLVSLATKLVTLKRKRKELEEQIAKIKDEAKPIEHEFIQYSKNHDIDGIRVDGALVSYSITPSFSIGEREKVLDFFKSMNMEHLITINWQTLNSTLKELINTNQITEDDIPTIGIKSYDKETIRIGGA